MSLRDYIATGEVLSESSARKFLSFCQDRIEYLSDARPFLVPVIPFQLFGVRYEEDIVIETTHPDWSMHEFARVRIDEKDVWIAKDSDQKGVQTVTSDLSNLCEWVAEAPVPRHSSKVEVIDRSTSKLLDVSLKYKNSLQQNVEVEFSAPRPGVFQRKRNGSTFNHSSNAISALLNIPRKQMLGVRAQVKFDGKVYSVRKVLGLIPVKALLKQSQGGVAAASMKLTSKTFNEFTVERPIAEDTWPTRAIENWQWQGDQECTGEAKFSNRVSRWLYRFQKGQLVAAEVYAVESPVAITTMRFSAPLPDFSRSFKGEVVRRFIVEIEGERQGYGEIRCRSSEKGAVIDFVPQKPYWFASRPMTTKIKFVSQAEVEIRTKRK